jgi:Tocopherol cyclase
MLARFRALGADLPYADLRRAHGVAMEGYFWRFSDARSGRVVIALCGVNRDAAGSWATVALGGHPGGFQREADLTPAAGDPDRLGVQAGGEHAEFRADERSVRVALGPGALLEAELHDPVVWSGSMLGGSGPAHLLPGLGQYWHPHVLGARVSGRAVLGGQEISLDGFTAYAEKNWGPGGFPPRWWWGQAQGFDRDDVCIAFAGGDVVIGPATVEATGVVVRVGAEIVRLGNPLLAPVRVQACGDTWSLRGRGARWSVELQGGAPLADAHALPIPLLAERHSAPGALEHLAARVRLVVRRRGRVLYAGESAIAGLEIGGAHAAVAELARRAAL